MEKSNKVKITVEIDKDALMETNKGGFYLPNKETIGPAEALLEPIDGSPKHPKEAKSPAFQLPEALKGYPKELLYGMVLVIAAAIWGAAASLDLISRIFATIGFTAVLMVAVILQKKEEKK